LNNNNCCCCCCFRQTDANYWLSGEENDCLEYVCVCCQLSNNERKDQIS